MAIKRPNLSQDKRSLFKDAISRFETTELQEPTARGANIPRRKNVLGRGLSALMTATEVPVMNPQIPATSGNAALAIVPDAYQEVVAETVIAPEIEIEAAPSQVESDEKSGLFFVSIDRVFANASQPRQHFDDAEIESLSNSIRETGLLQPILVRPKDQGRFEIVAGERRFRAATLAGLERIPVIVRSLTDRETLELGIVENVQRADLNPVEEAQAYQRLIDEFGATQADIAKTVGRDRASVANALRLLKLSPDVQQMLIDGALSAGHGRALLMLNSPGKQKTLAQKIIEQGLSVRAVERLVTEDRDEASTGNTSLKSKQTNEKTAHVIELEERFRRALGTKVNLNLNAEGKGQLTISFFSEEELEKLLDALDA